MKDTGRNVAIAILLAALLLATLMYTARAAAPAPTPAPTHCTIQCMMLAGCWYRPNDSAGEPIRNFWMWIPIYATLRSHQYHAVWNTADWRWIPK